MLVDSENKIFMIDINNAPMGDPYCYQYYKPIWSEYTKEISKILKL